jgi:hypothetical protein
MKATKLDFKLGFFFFFFLKEKKIKIEISSYHLQLNHHLTKKLKLIRNNKFDNLINILILLLRVD